MARFQIPGLDRIRQRDKDVHSALRAVEQAINNHSDQGNLEPSASSIAPPQPISNMRVVASGGIHDIQITDNSPAYAGIRYVAEYSQTSDFANYHRIDLGISQNHRANLGVGQFYWRARSYYHPSAPSAPVYHGGATPLAAGSGAYAGPAMQQGQEFTGLYRNSTIPPIRQ